MNYLDKYYESNSFNDIPFHDAELYNLKIDYPNNVIELAIEFDPPLGKDKKSYKTKVKLHFNDCTFFTFSNYAPWGKSYYIHSAEQDNNLDIIKNLKDINLKGVLHFNFLLNSGDNLNIYSKSFELITA